MTRFAFTKEHTGYIVKSRETTYRLLHAVILQRDEKAKTRNSSSGNTCLKVD